MPRTESRIFRKKYLVGVGVNFGAGSRYFICAIVVQDLIFNTLKRLFIVFRHLHRKADFESLGVVQQIVQRHGDHIWAEGIPNEAATFYFAHVPAIARQQK